MSRNIHTWNIVLLFANKALRFPDDASFLDAVSEGAFPGGVSTVSRRPGGTSKLPAYDCAMHYVGTEENFRT